MIRLFFYVEGQTEQQYAETILREHLAPFDVFVSGAILASTGKRHGVVHRGGGRHYAPIKSDLGRLLRQHHGSDVRFTTMFDLYALPVDFPGTADADKLKHIPEDRIRTLEQAFRNDIGDPRLIPHLQLYEFETLIYCELDALAIYYENCTKQIQALVEDAGGLLATPERIDDGQHTAPSKRIGRQFADYPDAKPDAPVAITSIIDLATIRAKCPHFNAWLETLEHLDH